MTATVIRISNWREALQDRELLMVGVIVSLAMLLLISASQAAYLVGFIDGGMKAVREGPTPEV
jgi:hypothetical protein